MPPLHVHEIVVDGDEPVVESLTLSQRREARRDTIAQRCDMAVKETQRIYFSDNSEQIIIWCGLNAEQAELESLLCGMCFSIQGSTPESKKIEYERRWREGERPVLVTKPECFSFGMNWQYCCNMIFVGLSDSYEKYYQAVRRCWRFGQDKPVNVYIIISKNEGCVKANIARKEQESDRMKSEMVKYTKEITKKELHRTCRLSSPYEPIIEMKLPVWEEFAA